MPNLWLCLFLILSLALPNAALAQHEKAYAPENLTNLAVPDQIRVIEKEYAEQSGGRRIPDDQLEFYLEQVRSGWSFSRIKQDIAESLRGGSGGGGGWRPPSGPAPGIVEILCESRNDRYTECPSPFRGQARVSRQLSSTRCIDGVNFGSRPGLVWVRNGCRARFVEDDRYDPPPAFGVQIACESYKNRYQECRTTFPGRAVLLRQLSSRECIEGRTWGNRLGVVWVQDGCRAVFGPSAGGGIAGHGYNVTCESADDRYRTCAWNARQGQPYLIEQLSRTACIEGRTWGYDRREGLWVDRGCRGRFGTR